ncbi:gamma-glutamylcyclotransferase [Falsirhodobacter algicola]|uniref:glutathione-specific gamma-glutamylcyclotransferase n=1 Tax=Falsirhodobacter algicola TaxID=2692330 RepID=A0A8J8MSQ7_9RHOB|nr:gamma-glutamylcyclotransferase [Falsirhodobacter algicola]QUS35779.1 gamma-glutamylcyclotransferase [Falsirhodobacter algicola]
MTERLWVFGYGSLIWDPCFPVERRVLARLDGWQRSFCMASVHYRGTPDAPGLVLALDRAEGHFCHGVAFLVAEGAEDAALAALRERELVSSAYLEMRLPLADPAVTALTYVIDPGHVQYCRHDAETQAQIIARAQGERGPNRDYLANTVRHLDDLGIPDPDLHELDRRVRDISP